MTEGSDDRHGDVPAGPGRAQRLFAVARRALLRRLLDSDEQMRVVDLVQELEDQLMDRSAAPGDNPAYFVEHALEGLAIDGFVYFTCDGFVSLWHARHLPARSAAQWHLAVARGEIDPASAASATDLEILDWVDRRQL